MVSVTEKENSALCLGFKEGHFVAGAMCVVEGHETRS